MADPVDEGGKFAAEALRNELILREIFKSLHVQSLLTCRRVNTQWNSLIVPLLRDHRQCPIVIPADKACERLQALEQDIEGITDNQGEDGVPYNGMKINLCQATGPCEGREEYTMMQEMRRHRYLRQEKRRRQQRRRRAEAEDNTDDDTDNELEAVLDDYDYADLGEPRPSWPNIISHLPLKFLSIHGYSGNRECDWYVSSLVRSLLHEKCGEITSIDFCLNTQRSCSEFVDRRQGRERPIFESLEVIKIGEGVKMAGESPFRGFLASIIRTAPHLRTLQGRCVSSELAAAIIPEDTYSLMDIFDFCPVDEQGIEFSLQVANAHAPLRSLSVRTNEIHPTRERLRRCQLVVDQVLQSSWGSLKKLFVLSNFIVAQITLQPQQPYANLVNLVLKTSGSTSDLWELIKSTDWGRFFPRAREVHLEVVGEVVPVQLFPGDDAKKEEIDFQLAAQQPSRARKLALLCDMNKVNFFQLHYLFPELWSLTLAGCYSYAIPYVTIFRLWPRLEELDAFDGIQGAVQVLWLGRVE